MMPREFLARFPNGTGTVEEAEDFIYMISERKSFPTYTALDQRGRVVASGMTRDWAAAFATYPEVRPLIVALWERQLKKDSWRTSVLGLNKKLAQAIVKAREARGVRGENPPHISRSEDLRYGGRATTPQPHIESGETTSHDERQRRTEEPDRHAAIVTRESLARLVRTGQEQFLNRRADWRVRDGRTYIEQDWSTETVSVEVRDDREYALVPTLLHDHRVGQETDPHWRCDLYVRDGNRYERQQIVLDVFVRDFDQLPEENR